MNSREKEISQIGLYSDECLVKAVVALKGIQGVAINETIDSIAGKSLSEIQQLTKRSDISQLYFERLASSFVDIKNTIASVDLERVSIYEKAKKNTNELYETKLNEILEILHNTSYGVYDSIENIYQDGKGSNEILDIIYEIKRQSEFIEASVKRLLSPTRRVLSNKSLIVALCVIAILLVPIFYYFNIDSSEYGRLIAMGGVTFLIVNPSSKTSTVTGVFSKKCGISFIGPEIFKPSPLPHF